MRMISQSLAEECVDYTDPFNASHPWLRRRVRVELETPAAPVDEVRAVLEEDGMAHVEK